MSEQTPEKIDERMIYIHGFSREDVFRIMTAVKAVVEDPQGIAFSVSTPTNIEWVIRDLVKEVREEHEYMRKHPPQRSGQAGQAKPES